jgi:hypothetical protein
MESNTSDEYPRYQRSADIHPLACQVQCQAAGRADPPVGRLLSRMDKRIHIAFTRNLYLADYKHFTLAWAGDKIAVQMAVMAEVRGIATGGQHPCSRARLSERHRGGRCCGLRLFSTSGRNEATRRIVR